MKVLATLIKVSLILVCAQVAVFAQDATNFSSTVLNLSRINNGGSARILGLGGAQTAIGGDISSVSSNPAGLGFFNRSEVSFSMQFNSISTSSSYLGNTRNDSKLNFNLPNLGVVIKNKGEKGKWKSQSFGVSINRMADFQNRITYQGNTFLEITPDNRPVDFLDQAVFDTELNGNTPSFFSDFAELAYNTFLTEVFEDADNPGEFFVDRNILDSQTGEPRFPTEEFPTTQRETIDIRGASSQFSISYGANYDDILYIGAGIGIASFNQEVERIFTERPIRTDLSELALTDVYEQSGIGINATLGIIARPVDEVLLGLSYTSPTYYTVTQDQELVLNSVFTDGDNFEDGIIFEAFDYSITTPSRLKGGATIFINKNGFITGEIEYVDYTGGRLSRADDGLSFDGDNQTINTFNNAFNYRAGMEYRYDIFRLRGGFAYLNDPFNNSLNEEERQITFGAGIRKKDFYFDVAVASVTNPESDVIPYPFAPVALVENNRTRITFTAGFKF
ncbi:hypothetical protein FNH22_18140 [Fulvivirga sp. M361]|uniref:OmpP1/FadL family transporter n=1 Tax=Fulvivirga sp. M361 TaxID=2594266 RepID=UPI00117AABF0|nr:hypothetical protein [Fulvivirga sp. M361]TRX55554.1 hypothetical protein FNH22_18140 [Fulvivirga sp. M361]